MTIIKYAHGGDEYLSTLYYGSLARPITMDGVEYYGESSIVRKTEKDGTVVWLTNVEALVRVDGKELDRGPWIEAEPGALPESVTSRFDTEDPVEEGGVPGFMWVRAFVMNQYPRFVELSTENGLDPYEATDEFAQALIDLGNQLMGKDDTEYTRKTDGFDWM